MTEKMCTQMTPCLMNNEMFVLKENKTWKKKKRRKACLGNFAFNENIQNKVIIS